MPIRVLIEGAGQRIRRGKPAGEKEPAVTAQSGKTISECVMFRCQVDEGQAVVRERSGKDVNVREDCAERRGNDGDAPGVCEAARARRALSARVVVEKSFADERADDSVRDGIHQAARHTSAAARMKRASMGCTKGWLTVLGGSNRNRQRLRGFRGG